MAYNGYLLKIGEFTFPNTYIQANTYSPYVNMQDLNPYTDADGYVHRNPLILKALKVEFSTIPMDNTVFAELMGNIQRQYINADGRECEITAYIPEYDSYVTQRGYMADFTPQIYGIFNNVIYYNPIRVAFVGGVADD